MEPQLAELLSDDMVEEYNKKLDKLIQKCIKKYTTHLAQAYIVHTGDVKEDGDYLYIPLYMVPCL